MNVVEARGLVLSPYREAEAFDFAIGKNERWLLRGPSRSGKTPLLKTLCGLMSPAAGEVVLFGRDLAGLKPSALLAMRRSLAFVFEVDGLLPAWTGFENLALPLKYHDRYPNEEINDRVEACARRYRLPADWMDNPVGALSAERRLALALVRALIVEPELLLLDALPIDAVEAFSGIDGATLLRDAIGGDRAVIYSLPAEAGERLPAIIENAGFRSAAMLGGRIESASRPL